MSSRLDIVSRVQDVARHAGDLSLELERGQASTPLAGQFRAEASPSCDCV